MTDQNAKTGMGTGKRWRRVRLPSNAGSGLHHCGSFCTGSRTKGDSQKVIGAGLCGWDFKRQSDVVSQSHHLGGKQCAQTF